MWHKFGRFCKLVAKRVDFCIVICYNKAIQREVEMSRQLNARIPKSTEKQIDDLIEWTGMTQTQLIIQAIDRMHQEQKRERDKEMGYIAYKRDINAGFATETVLVKDGVVVDQSVKTHNAASEVEGLPDLLGSDISTLRGKGFRQITSQAQRDALIERYESRSPEIPGY
jgi:hypothetical protein